MRQFGLRFSAALLIGVLIAGSELLIAASATPSAPAASCHGQSHSKSTPQPVSYQCCVVGHSPALQPDIAASVILLIPVASVDVPRLIISERTVVEFSKITASPPPLISLRI